MAGHEGVPLDNDGDELTSNGIAAAEAIGRDRLTPPYVLFGSTGASRTIDPDLVERETLLLGNALRGVFDAMPEDGRAMEHGEPG